MCKIKFNFSFCTVDANITQVHTFERIHNIHESSHKHLTKVNNTTQQEESSGNLGRSKRLIGTTPQGPSSHKYSTLEMEPTFVLNLAWRKIKEADISCGGFHASLVM